MKKMIFFLIAILILQFSAFRTPVTPEKPITQHPENPNYFLFQSKPTILVTSGEHYGAVMNAGFDFEKYLNTLADNGMNYTRIFTGSYSEMGSTTFGISNNTMNPKPGQWLSPWPFDDASQKYKLGQWNPAYFERLHRFMAFAQARNIVVEVTLFTSYYADNQWNITPFNPKNNHLPECDSLTFKKLNTLGNGPILKVQEEYVCKMVRELNKYPNFFFEIQNEPWADNPNLVEKITETDAITHPFAWQKLVETGNETSLAWQKHIAQVITDTEKNLPNKHLIAQNISNFRNIVQNPDPNVSILNFHYAYPEAASANLGLSRVIGLDETGFMPHTDFLYRSQAWKFMLSGGALYNNLDYSFTVGNEDGLYKIDTGTPGWGGPDLRSQLKIMKNFLLSIDFINMKPDNSVITIKQGNVVNIQVFAQSGRQYALYIEKPVGVVFQLNIPDGEYRITWLDPVSGVINNASKMSATNGKLEIPCPDFGEDVVLKMTRIEY